MPEISRFLGIIIRMFYNEHNPPHFHAIYGEYEAIFDIMNLNLLKGSLPPKAISLVTEWAMIHKYELEENWNRILSNESLKQIEPLS